MGPEVTFIWRSADTVPKTGDFPIIYRTANKKIGTLKMDTWKFYKEKYNIKYWVSAKDLFE